MNEPRTPEQDEEQDWLVWLSKYRTTVWDEAEDAKAREWLERLMGDMG